MTQKVTAPADKKMNPFLRAMVDLVILGLFLVGAGFGGYFWGIHQQLAPVVKVAAGTPGALPPGALQPTPVGSTAASPSGKKGETAASGTSAAAASAAATTAGSAASGSTPSSEGAKTTGSAASAAASHPAAVASAEKTKSKKKFWIASSGVDYIGYSITAKVNGTAIDSFFGPGKIVDITHLVKPGDNTLVCDSKQMGDQYNKHSGDAKSKLTLQLVSDAHISDSFKKSDVLLSYERSAADTEDDSDTLHFTGE